MSLKLGLGSKMISLDSSEIIEKYIIVLLGVVDRPIPSIIHLEKEMFLLSKAYPKIKKIIEFSKHNFGPYSDEIRDIIEDSGYTERDLFMKINSKITLTEKGKKKYNELVKKYENDEKFKQLLILAKMIRTLYDKLNEDELMFLIYETYPEYKEKSIKYFSLQEKKKKLIKSMLRKGIITEARFKELQT